MAATGPPWAPELRYLTADEPPIPLSFKSTPEDFVVDEELSFEASGTGEHLLVRVEKRGLATTDLVRRMSEQLDVEAREIGWAGRKDARAVTRQWLSIPARAEERLSEIESEGVRVLDRVRNDRKLRLGALAGNRFELRLRGIAREDRERVERSLETLGRRGVPNYFGAQRFGRHGFGFELGRALVRGEWREHLSLWTSGRHGPCTPALERLHALIEEGRPSQLRGAKELAGDLPREYVSLAHQLSRRRGDWRSALRAVDRRTLEFHVSSYQSFLFNRVLARRVETFDRPQLGDIVVRHPGKGHFEYGANEDPSELARRAEVGEISPTGPLPGARCSLAGGAMGELEREILAEEEALPHAFAGRDPGQGAPGERRSLRAMPRALCWEWRDEDLHLVFGLPPGSFATTLIEELAKGAGD